MSGTNYRPGDWVIFTMTKFSIVPGPRAANIHPTPGGDGYSYTVDKFWVVVDVDETGEVTLQTRRGKQHRLQSSDFRLRKATMLEQHRHRGRYSEIERGIRPSSSAG